MTLNFSAVARVAEKIIPEIQSLSTTIEIRGTVSKGLWNTIWLALFTSLRRRALVQIDLINPSCL